MRSAPWIWALLACAACSRQLSVPQQEHPSISGKVVVEEVGTGRVLPAPGARVELAGTGNATLSDGFGLFTLKDLPPIKSETPRSLLVQWSSSGGAFDRQRLLRGSFLEQPGAIALGDVEVAANAEVRGRVLLDDKDPDAPEHVGIVAFVPLQSYSAVTGPAGSFQLTRLPPGTLSIGFAHAGYQTRTIDSVQLSSGASVELQALSLARLPPGTDAAGAISGSAVRPDGAKAEGAVATVTAAGGAEAAGTAALGGDGRFKFQLPAGAYAVKLTDGGRQLQALVGGVLVQPGKTTELGELRLSGAPIQPPPPSAPGPLPVAKVGADQFVAPVAPVLLDGSGSDGDRLVYHWKQEEGPEVHPAPNHSALAARASFTAPPAGSLAFSLQVTDAFGQVDAHDPVTRVFVNTPPTAALAAVPATASPGTTVLLDASGSKDADTGDVLAYTFLQVQGTQVSLGPGALPSQRSFVAGGEGTYSFYVVVDDGHARSSSPLAVVVVSQVNHPPTARAAAVNEASPGRPIQPGDDVGLDATASTDPDSGQTLSFTWTPLVGAPAPVCSATAPGCAVAHVVAPPSGTWSYGLTATDSGSPALSDQASVSFTVGPPPTTVFSRLPAAGAVDQSPFTQVVVTYSQFLDSTDVLARPPSASSGSTSLAGSTAYSTSAGRGRVTWTPSAPLPPAATVDVSFPAWLDLNGNPAEAAVVTFTTRALHWVDRSPPNPLHTGTYTGAQPGDVAFSYAPFGPALVAAPSGSYLSSMEFDGPFSNTSAHPHLRRWDMMGKTWAEVALAAQFAYGANVGQRIAWKGVYRTYLGVEPQGGPLLAWDGAFNQTVTWYRRNLAVDGPVSFGTTAIGAGLGHDGQAGTVSARCCKDLSNSGAPAKVGVCSVPSEANTVFNGYPIDFLTWGLLSPGGPRCDFDLDYLVGPPAQAPGAGRIYLAVAYVPAPSATYVMNLFTRRTSETTYDQAGVLDGGTLGLTDGGVLNGAAVGWETWAALAPTPKGPVLAFIENPGDATSGRIRVMRWDEASRTMVDPLYDAPGNGPSSVLTGTAHPFANGDTWEQPSPPSLVAVGTTPYLAFAALNQQTARHRVLVFHADVAAHKWTLDADLAANADGALNANPCANGPAASDAIVPSIALVDGLPMVAWNESCLILPPPDSNPVQTANYLVVKRLE